MEQLYLCIYMCTVIRTFKCILIHTLPLAHLLCYYPLVYHLNSCISQDSTATMGLPALLPILILASVDISL
jgi:hypothetical protein